MKNIVSLICLLFLLSCSDDSTSPGTEKGTIKGFVFNSETNERIPDAYIATEPLTSSMKTNSNGNFELKEIDPGNYFLIVTKQGYKPYRSEIKVSNNITNDLQIPLDTVPETVELNHLIGNWKLDNNSLDSGPNHYDGIEEGVLYVTDRNGVSNNAASFNGHYLKTNSKILLSKSIVLSNNFTIALWVKQSASLGENGSVGNFDCFSQWGGSGSGLASYNLGIDKDQYIYFTTYGTNGNKKHEVFNERIKSDTWYHIAITFENGIVNFYLNGKLNRNVSGFPLPQNSILNPSIGGRSDQLSSFHGAIDDVYLFDKVLTLSEIMEIAQ